MKIRQRLCQFVDYDLSKTGYANSGALSLLIALMVVMAPLPFVSRAYDGLELTAIFGAVALSLAWMVFVAWRGWRLSRAAAIKADRNFDRADKFKLPSEYQVSESATKAARNKVR